MIYPGGPRQAAGGAVQHAHFGKYPGIVVDRAPANDAGHHRGELVVRVPGILEEDGAGGQQPLEAIAKPCFVPGHFWVPEVGDPVWVEFAAGDINSPIWTGVWYPVDATPATAEGEAPTEDQKVLRTPSGQVVHLEDTAGAEKLVLTDETNGNRVVMDAAGVLLEDQAGNSVTLESGGIKLEAGGCSIELGGTTVTITNGVHTLEIGSTGTKLTDALSMSPQAIVLEPVLTWLTTHQHMGNMGAPAPIFPAQLPEIMLHANAGSGKSAL
jgi:hypothetical protein